MKGIVLHDAFVPQGCAGKLAPQPAVTAQAGAVWMHVYDAVTTQAGRYVQGGGCTTVGVAASFKAAVSTASPRTTAWPLRACSRPKSSPQTAR